MRIFARQALWQSLPNDGRDQLLLEGDWPGELRQGGRWSLDESIDARFMSIDRQAIELAETAAHGSPEETAISFAYINALALRYYLVKLLRGMTFFREVRPLMPGERIDVHLAAKRDEAYADLFEQLVERRGAALELHWHERPLPKVRSNRHALAWRQWADRARRRPVTPVPDDDAPRVVLCGNPRILNPICQELLERGCRVWWLYERFAVRCWWRWRRAGVGQLVCESDGTVAPRFSDVWNGTTLMCGDVDLARPVERWLVARAAEHGRQQSLLIDRVESHFSAVRPTAVVLDEDATPLKRIATALARRHGARSTVVQHGATCGPFGFVPPAADEICVWAESVRRQLERWGAEPEKIRVTGWAQLQPNSEDGLPRPSILPRDGLGRPSSRFRQPKMQSGAKQFLLLATVEPCDDRPDNVEFHLTSGNYAEMLQMVHDVLSQIEQARLVIKLHPRARRAEFLRFQPRHQRPEAGGERRQQGTALPVRVEYSNKLSRLVAKSDCVISCGSTAGIEAALAGAPVVQLLPAGSGNILPAEDWRLIGTARTADELATLISAALARGWCKPGETADSPLAATGGAAARAIVEGLLAATGAHDLLAAGCC